MILKSWFSFSYVIHKEDWILHMVYGTKREKIVSLLYCLSSCLSKTAVPFLLWGAIFGFSLVSMSVLAALVGLISETYGKNFSMRKGPRSDVTLNIWILLLLILQVLKCSCKGNSYLFNTDASLLWKQKWTKAHRWTTGTPNKFICESLLIYVSNGLWRNVTELLPAAWYWRSSWEKRGDSCSLCVKNSGPWLEGWYWVNVCAKKSSFFIWEAVKS